MGRKIISISIIASLTASFAFFIVPPRSAYAAIAFDAASSAAASTAASSLTFPHTVASGNSRLLIVGVTIADTSNAVATVTYGGTSMISLGVASRGAGKPEVSLWYLVAPATGANNVVVTLTSGQTDRMMAGAVSFTNVHQSTPVGTFFSAASKASPATVGVTGTNLGDVVIDIIGNMDPAAGNTLAVGANQTERWQGSTGSGSDQVLGGMSTESSSGGTVTMSWTLPQDEWAIGAVAIKPATAVSATASADTTWIKGGTTGKNIVFTVNNSAGSDGPLQFVKFTRPSANYTITAGSATGWSAAVSGGSTVTFTGGSIAAGGSGTFTVTADTASADEARTAWTVEVDNDTGGANKVAATESSTDALKTGIDSTAPTSVSISSVSADSETQLTANAATASDSGSGLNSTPYWFNETTGNSGGSDSISWQASTAWVDTGLSGSTQYCYQVKARDAVLNESTFSTSVCQNTTSTADTTAPAAVANLAASNPTGNSVTLTWTAPGDDGSTGTATTYDVRYSTSDITDGNWASATAASGEPSPQAAGSSESFTVTGLTTSTTYYFALKTSDEAPNTSGLSNVATSTTAAVGDTTAPNIIAVGASGITTSGATITWTTDEAADSQVEYGTTISYGSQTALNAALATSHSVTLSGLDPAVTYHYRVKSKDAAQNLATSVDSAFTTNSVGGTVEEVDTKPPVMSQISAETTTSTAKITWRTNEDSTTQVEYGTSTTYGELTLFKELRLETYAAAHEKLLVNLEPNTKYNFRVISIDSFQNKAISGNFTFATEKLPPPPPPPPPVFKNVGAPAVRPTSVKINWETNIPSTSQVRFGTKSGELAQATVEFATLNLNHSINVSDLLPDTNYWYVVVSRNAVGIEGVSAEETFRTESLEIQLVVEIVKPAALPPGSPETQIPNTVAGETATVVSILPTAGDIAPPEVTLFEFTENPTENRSPIIRGRAIDRKGVIAGISYSTDGGASWHPITEVEGIGSSAARFSAKIINLRDGNYPILFRVRDNSNNISKSQAKVLIVDQEPPTTGANVFLLGRQSLLPSSSGLFSTIAGLTHRVVVSASGGAITVQMIASKADSAEISEEKAFPLIYSKNTNLWFGDVQISEPGLYNLTLRAEDGTKKISNTAANSIFVEKPGKVVDAEKQTAINGAKVSVYQYSPDDYNYVLWPGEVFNQANPQITGADGFYRLILPPGKYYLKVEAGGFRSVFSDTFELEGHEAISLTISLSKMPAFSINLPFLKNIKLPLPNLPQIFGVKYASSKTAEVVVPEKISALLGKPAPIFSLPDLNGELLGIRNLRGKKVIITTWASWAPLAQVQIPILDQLQREEKEDVRVLLISPHLSAGIVDTYLRRGKYNLASVIDEEGKFGKLYPVLTIPEHFFIDRRGILRDVYVGLLDGDGLKKKLSELQ